MNLSMFNISEDSLKNIICMLMCAYGLYSLFYKSSEKNQKVGHYISRVLLATTMFTWVAYIIISRYLNTDAYNVFATTALSIARFYAAVMLLEPAFSIMINSHYNVKKGIKKNIWALFILNAILLSSYLFLNQSISELVLGICTSIFVYNSIMAANRFYKLLKLSVLKKNDPKTNRIIFLIRWTIYSLIAIMLVKVLMDFTIMSMPDVLKYIFPLFGITIITIIFALYHNYKFNVSFSRKTISLSIQELRNTNHLNVRQDLLGQDLDNWVNDGGYTEKGITVENLARKLNTNRTYLSAYVNNQFKLSFREWLTSLRIERAKQIIIENPHYSISEVADKVGYTASSFAKQFKLHNDVGPMKWRNDYLSKHLLLGEERETITTPVKSIISRVSRVGGL